MSFSSYDSKFAEIKAALNRIATWEFTHNDRSAKILVIEAVAFSDVDMDDLYSALQQIGYRQKQVKVTLISSQNKVRFEINTRSSGYMMYVYLFAAVFGAALAGVWYLFMK